jgi:hypothetical protein
MSTDRWEYARVDRVNEDRGLEQLSKLGHEGWDLQQVVECNRVAGSTGGGARSETHLVAFLRRPWTGR